MELINCIEDISGLTENKIIFEGADPCALTLISSSVCFKGSGNVLYVCKGVTLSESTISFEGSNSLVFLSGSKHPYKISLTLFNNNTAHFGKDCYFNDTLKAILSEEKHLWIGNEALLSYGITMRLADPHLIYDCSSHRRINPSESIFIGDHVWIGQDTLILKGAKIGSGSIIGAKSIVPKKTVPSNQSWGGTPVKFLRSGVFFVDYCVHAWTKEKTDRYSTYNSNQFVYNADGNTVSYESIDSFLSSEKDVSVRLDYILNKVPNGKNRFYIPPVKKKRRPLFFKRSK